ncbi:hypothetical protein [uncultured Jatrophihabitans sp.]|uniref:hypothetical protein n=1 Tax=uncultured Jatrophihabitans sp. TaxID=1610747 RepID=UPI0035C9A3D4
MTNAEPVDLFVAGRAVLVESSNPHDPTADDLQELVQDLRGTAAGFGLDTFHVPDEVHGAGTTLWHMVYVWLPDVSEIKGELYGSLTTAAAAYLGRWRRKRQQERNRPGEVRFLYGPHGEVLRRVTVHANEDDVTVSDGEQDDIDSRPLRFMRRHQS